MSARGIGIAPALCGFARVVGCQLHQWHFLIDQGHHFARWHDFIHAPTVAGSHVHVFNEAQHHARALKASGHGQYLVGVGATLDHHVDFDAAELTFGIQTQTRVSRRINARQHIGHREIHIVHAAKDGIIQAIQTHGDAMQTRSLQCFGFFGKQ